MLLRLHNAACGMSPNCEYQFFREIILQKQKRKMTSAKILKFFLLTLVFQLSFFLLYDTRLSKFFTAKWKTTPTTTIETTQPSNTDQFMRFFVGSILDYSLEINFPPSRDLATGKPMPDNAATSPAITKACVENEKCGRGRRAEVALRCLSGRFFFFFCFDKGYQFG